MSPQTFDLFVTLMIFFFLLRSIFFFLACAPASSRDPKINWKYLRPPNFDTKHSIEITKDFSHLRTSFYFFLSLRFIFCYPTIRFHLKKERGGRVFFLCLIKNLALKLMARFSLHKRGSNEDPGTNNSFMGTGGSNMCPSSQKKTLKSKNCAFYNFDNQI